jgi:GT2 family glycosyltransferase
MLDVLVPTYRRPHALAILLTSLAGQTLGSFRVVVSDQSENGEGVSAPGVRSVARVLRAQGREVELVHHLPRRGVAEHRDALLARARAPYCLFCDDDVLLEPNLLARLLETIREERCGFVGSGLVGASYVDDVRPDEQALELWEGGVEPERVAPGLPSWERHRLHNAANLHHVAAALGLGPEDRVRYKVAWVGGCVLYDTEALRAAGGFGFWRELPAAHAGEDVVAQLRVMARRGGCAILPSGAYHLELPTTVPDRTVDAPRVLALGHAA